MLTRGELSLYHRFGFVPNRRDYNLYNDKIRSITSRLAIDSFEKYSYEYNDKNHSKITYRWVDPIIEVLSGRDDKLMIDEIRESNLQFGTFFISEVEFNNFIRTEWGIIRYTGEWILRQ